MWQRLVQQAREGDLSAFDSLMARYQDSVVGLALALLGDFEQARDAAQETFIQAWRDLRQLRDCAAFPSWLLGIARHRCHDLVRRPALPQIPLEVAAAQTGPGNDPAEEVARRQTRERVLAEIAALPEGGRVTTTLFYIDGYTVREVAGLLNVPEGTVKRRLYEARKRLQRSVAAMVEETLHAGKPGPELRAQIAAELRRRQEEWEGWLQGRQQWALTRPEEEVTWAHRWHELRLADVQANAAQYGLVPDLKLPRMLPEYHMQETFRDDLEDVPRRWGLPEGIALVSLRDLVRELRVRPVTVRRWEQEGLPVVHYRPWVAYDRDRVGQWLAERQPAELAASDRPEVERPLLTVLEDVAAGHLQVAEGCELYEALETATLMGPEDPQFAAGWAEERVRQREANAKLYGLQGPTHTWLGTPEEVRSYEIRDLVRRLALSPLEVAAWTRSGLPCLRIGGYVRYDVELVSAWLEGQGGVPTRCPIEDLDRFDAFILQAILQETGRLEDGYEALSGRMAVM